MRIGAAAAPRWWGVDQLRLPAYLAHLSASGASSVEFIVHHGPATRDPATVHLDRATWDFAVREATRRGLHVDIHNSLDPGFRLDRWTTDPDGLKTDLAPILDLLASIEQQQASPPVFVVHAAERCSEPEAVTREVLAWLASELVVRRIQSVACVELRAGAGLDDERFDRDRNRLVTFVEKQRNPAIGVCWDVSNEWLSSVRIGRNLAMPDTMPSCVRHVHLHGATSDGLLHAPLGDGNVPWVAALDLVRSARWAGSVTLEIRYRLAHDIGEPWTVLAESISRALHVR